MQLVLAKRKDKTDDVRRLSVSFFLTGKRYIHKSRFGNSWHSSIATSGSASSLLYDELEDYSCWIRCSSSSSLTKK